MSIVEVHDQQRGGVLSPLVKLLNPMVTEESALRRDLLPGLLGPRRDITSGADRHRCACSRSAMCLPCQVHPSPKKHAAALHDKDADGTTPNPELPEELELVHLLADADDDADRGDERLASDLGRLETWSRLRSVHHDVDFTGRTGELVAGGIVLGVVGEVDPETLRAFDLAQSRVGWLELELSKLAAAPRRSLAARPISRFPSSDIDLAFVVEDSVPAGLVEATLLETAGELCESVELFDVYRGAGVPKGSRSLAYRLRFCALDRTLTDAEIAELRAACITAVETRFHATLRS